MNEKLRKQIEEKFAPLAGQKFLGVVVCSDCVELVFDGPDHNLLTMFEPGRPIQLGFVKDPVAYVSDDLPWPVED